MLSWTGALSKCEGGTGWSDLPKTEKLGGTKNFARKGDNSEKGGGGLM